MPPQQETTVDYNNSKNQRTPKRRIYALIVDITAWWSNNQMKKLRVPQYKNNHCSNHPLHCTEWCNSRLHTGWSKKKVYHLLRNPFYCILLACFVLPLYVDLYLGSIHYQKSVTCHLTHFIWNIPPWMAVTVVFQVTSLESKGKRLVRVCVQCTHWAGLCWLSFCCRWDWTRVARLWSY